MNQEKSIDILNTLIITNNDRIEGYETASKETTQKGLKTIFSQFENTSRECNIELIEEVTQMGGKPEEGTSIKGKFFRILMDLKASITSNDRKAILECCEYGEEVAENTYQDAISENLEDLNAAQHVILNAQLTLLKADREALIGLKNDFVRVY